MSRWTESQFVEQAQRIAQRHTTTKESLNQLSEKVARENDLNPDEIRTLVRLANVATFQESFRLKTGGDKMVEFNTGDPEAVIRSMLVTEAPVPASVSNDKLASYTVPDQMRAKRYGVTEEAVKEAAEVAEETRPVRRDLLVLNLRKLAEEFTVEKIAAGQKWEDTLGALTQWLKRPQGYGVSYHAFEKDAWAAFGNDIRPELVYLQEELKISRPLPAVEKVAELQQKHLAQDSQELDALKTAFDARQQFLKLSQGLKWVDAQLAQLE